MMDVIVLVVSVVVLGCSVALLGASRRSAPSLPPAFLDLPAKDVMASGGFAGLPEGTTAVWMDTSRGWIECRWQPNERVWRPLFGEAIRGTRIRSWLGPRGEELSIQGAGLLTSAALAHREVQFAATDDHAELGAAFTDVWRQVGKLGWTPAMPDGEGLLRLRGTQSAERFAVRVAETLEEAIRAGLTDRQGAETRQVAAARLHAAAAALVGGIHPSLVLDGRAPRGVGPRDKERWIVDEPLAVSLGNAPVNGVVQPLLVLRPVVVQGAHVLLEGVVA